MFCCHLFVLPSKESERQGAQSASMGLQQSLVPSRRRFLTWTTKILKINRWNLKTKQLKRNIIWTKPAFGFKMLIFQDVKVFQLFLGTKMWRFLGMTDYTWRRFQFLVCGHWGNDESMKTWEFAQIVYFQTLVHVYLDELGLSLHAVFAREPAEHDFASRW